VVVVAQMRAETKAAAAVVLAQCVLDHNYLVLEHLTRLHAVQVEQVVSQSAAHKVQILSSHQ
jgi:hypothetical protein